MSQGIATGRLGDRLVGLGLLTEERLELALREQRRHHRPLGQILVSLGFVEQELIARLLAQDLGIRYLPAGEVRPDPLILSGLDAAFVREARAFPFELREGVLHVAMVEPDDPRRVAQVRKRFPYPLQVAMTTEADLHALLRAHLQARTSRLADLMADVHEGAGQLEDFPVEAVTEAILADGVHRHATDVHVEPEEHVTRVRYRVDGILQSGESLPAAVTPAVVSRIKILAHLDISERRRPQDGRIRLELDERQIDLRVSIMPSAHGENVVLRILESTTGSLRLEGLGVAPAVHAVLRRVAERSHGLFLVTGPTGSGKTTTLYAMLAEVDAVHRKVATVEDPIEYRLPLLRQSQVDPSIGFTFAAGLRSLLRQDPDVILVGEIRDRETADMALKASMTGHLVFSTLHTNSAVGAVPRLVDMGIEPFLVEDSLIGAMSQRLVRRVCASCADEVAASAEELAWLGGESRLVRRGHGCERCDGTGYQGRTVLVELFLPSGEVVQAMRAGAGADRLEVLARREGFQPMEEDGKRLVREGVTTMEEVLRVGRSHRLTLAERSEAGA